MIEIELTTAIVLYSGVLGALVAAIWLYTELSVRRPQQSLGKQFLWRCTICGLSYLDEEAVSMSQCPRCGSYNTPQEARRTRGAAALETDPPERHDGPRRSGSKGKRRGQRHRGGRRRR